MANYSLVKLNVNEDVFKKVQELFKAGLSERELDLYLEEHSIPEPVVVSGFSAEKKLNWDEGEMITESPEETSIIAKHYLEWFDSVKDTEGELDQFKRITDQMRYLYSIKNKDYGNSFDKSLNEDGLIASKVRIGDKYRRFGQLIDNDAKVKDESIRDTLIDMANYAIMTVMWLDSVKNDIPYEEFKDMVENDNKEDGASEYTFR